MTGATRSTGKTLSMSSLAIASICLFLSACTTTGNQSDAAQAYRLEANDPYEDANRAIFAFNDGVDEAILEPISSHYGKILPKPVQTGVNNIVRHVRSPIIFTNDVLQGEMGRAGDTLGRFTVNTLFGFFGIWDVAQEMGIEYHSEDFGQTLAVWGVPSGPYIMMPLLGPGNLREHLGSTVDMVFQPMNWWSGEDALIVNGSVRAMRVVQTRADNIERIGDLKKTSLDYYASVRSFYQQNRESEILNGKQSDEDLDEFDLDDF